MRRHLILCLAPCLLFAQPAPPMMNPAGRQHPYITMVTIQTTQRVETVLSVKYMQLIEASMTTNGLVYTETNLVAVRTNIIYSVTNSYL